MFTLENWTDLIADPKAILDQCVDSNDEDVDVVSYTFETYTTYLFGEGSTSASDGGYLNDEACISTSWLSPWDVPLKMALDFLFDVKNKSK